MFPVKTEIYKLWITKVDKTIIGAVGIGTDLNPPVFMVIPPNPQPPRRPDCFGYGPFNVKMVVSGISPCPSFDDPTIPFPDPNGVFVIPIDINSQFECRWTLDGGIIYVFDMFFSGGALVCTVQISLFSPAATYFSPTGFGNPSSPTFSNSLTDCSGATAGTGGSVTVSF